MNPPRLLRFDAAAACDAANPAVFPASILIEAAPEPGPSGFRSRILAVGKPADVDAHPASRHALVTARPHAVLIPGLVNAHAHLDLTHIGPRPHDSVGGFVPWVEMIRAQRHTHEDAIAASVRRGIALSLAAGTVAVGDIAGAPRGRSSLAPFRELAASPLRGVSFIEFFAIGSGRDRYLDWLPELLREAPAQKDGGGGRVRVGLQPHAPNTVAPSAYRWAAQTARDLGLPLATHLAESPEERLFVGRGEGPQRRLLESVGVWDDSILLDFGRGQTPVAHMAEILAAGPFLVAHANDADDAAIQTLARTGASVAYCPRASDYFGAHEHFGPHRYRDMLAAGIQVCLGTDSIVNLPPDAASRGLSILDEMRFLHSRDGTDPRALLRMATLNGADAIGLAADSFVFAQGNPVAGVLAIELPGTVDEEGGMLEAMLGSSERPELLFLDNRSD